MAAPHNNGLAAPQMGLRASGLRRPSGLRNGSFGHLATGTAPDSAYSLAEMCVSGPVTLLVGARALVGWTPACKSSDNSAGHRACAACRAGIIVGARVLAQPIARGALERVSARPRRGDRGRGAGHAADGSRFGSVAGAERPGRWQRVPGLARHRLGHRHRVRRRPGPRARAPARDRVRDGGGRRASRRASVARRSRASVRAA
jgi:hypothetical protein